MFKTTMGVATLFLLAAITAVVTAQQQRPNRISDQQVAVLLSRMDTGIAAFRVSFDHAIDRSRLNGSRAEDDIKQSVNDFRQAADRFRERARNGRAGAADVDEMMSRAASIDRFIKQNSLDAAANRDWRNLRSTLDELALAYGVTWNWTRSESAASRVNDQQVVQLLTRARKDADQFRQSLDRALNGSRIDGSREENDIRHSVADFAETTSRLSERFDRS